MKFFLSHFCPVAATISLALTTTLVAQNPAVLTAEYDNNRTTANNNELLLNPTTVSPLTFGKLGTWALDGRVIAQPLYVPGAKIGKLKLNVLYVATMNNSVYALNADAPGSTPLWQVKLGAPVPTGYAGTCPSGFETGTLGILSTPVIDNNSNVIYVVAANPVPNQAAYKNTLYALDLGDGSQVHGGSTVISGSVPGTGTESVNGVVSFGPTTTKLIQRPALTLSKSTVYVGFSGCGPDPSPYHGWVVGYRAGNIQQQVFTYNATPNGDLGGIWQGGRGLVADSSGSLYLETGNGSFDQQTDFGESIVKLSFKGDLQDWFTPTDAQSLSDYDIDLSTTSPLLAPDSNLLIGGGKQGLVYVLNPNSLGHFGGAQQTFFGATYCEANFISACQKIHSMAYWQSTAGSMLYIWGTNDILRGFKYQNGQFLTSPATQGFELTGYPGGILTVTSALGAPATGILWAITDDGLHAFSAMDVGTELWNSNQNAARDSVSGGHHFEQMTVVNGKVFLPDQSGDVLVYGLLPH